MHHILGNNIKSRSAINRVKLGLKNGPARDCESPEDARVGLFYAYHVCSRPLTCIFAIILILAALIHFNLFYLFHVE